MRTMMAIVTGAALLAGCGGGSDTAPNPAASKTPLALSETQKKVVALPKRLQDGVMLRAIRDAGLTCQAVTELTRVETRADRIRWRVVCDNSEPYVVEITPDGTAQIRSRN
ncbi:hypothetical protein [Sphingomonas sp. CCH9-H8]|uniref:hypothetical protein n=2 Tax=unclassified Sphingomonas TaxID=196159 RepID=UPI000AA3747E|nr:hypothetical protein [Sphingomonas sp. CCH9-H8]